MRQRQRERREDQAAQPRCAGARRGGAPACRACRRGGPRSGAPCRGAADAAIACLRQAELNRHNPDDLSAIPGPVARIPSRCRLNQATRSYRLRAPHLRRLQMRRVFTACGVIVGLLLTSPLFAQSKAKAQNVPEIAYDSVPNFLKFPPNIYLGEGIGVATNCQGARVRLHAERRHAPLRVRSERRLRARDRRGALRLHVRARGARRQGRQHLDRRRRVEHGHQVQPGGPGGDGDRPAARTRSTS